jgi:hypothetical protein
MTQQTSAAYDPVIKMTAHSVNDGGKASEVVTWNGTLSSLFSDWRKNGTDCEEQTGASEQEVRDELQASSSYQIDGFVGCFFMLHVVQ